MAACQVSVLVGRGLLHNTRCQLVMLCVLSEAVVQLGNNVHLQSTVVFDVINLAELTFGSVTVHKVVIVIGITYNACVKCKTTRIAT